MTDRIQLARRSRMLSRISVGKQSPADRERQRRADRLEAGYAMSAHLRALTEIAVRREDMVMVRHLQGLTDEIARVIELGASQ
jgi:hypothetical protein